MRRNAVIQCLIQANLTSQDPAEAMVVVGVLDETDEGRRGHVRHVPTVQQ